jgi:glucose/arabinose dehydrogenase
MKLNLFCILFASSFFCHSQSMMMVGNTQVNVDTVITGLDIPWEIIYGPDNHIWTTERKGIVSRINPITGVKSVILNLSSSIFQQSESGLLGMALHPNFPNTAEVFLA